MKSINKKIKKLYRSRGVIIRDCALTEEINLSISIHRLIYKVDLHYENNCNIDDREVTKISECIEDKLYRECVCRDWAIECSFRLKSYKIYEDRIHQGDVLSKSEHIEIGLKKCADVSLARAIVRGKNNKNIGKRVLEIENYIDVVLEIVEDYEDIEEDISDWNFNYWLYPIKEKKYKGNILSIVNALYKVGCIIEYKYESLNTLEKYWLGNKYIYVQNIIKEFIENKKIKNLLMKVEGQKIKTYQQLKYENENKTKEHSIINLSRNYRKERIKRPCRNA